jgi:glycine/D-amino acid oxidase-like deaminating enzyme
LTPRRALVIGAGHNGLLCAGTLAQAGWEVTVLEQASHPGGAVHSAAGPLPGFMVDPCAAFFPLTRASPAFAAIDLEAPGVEWVEPPIAMAHPLPDGRAGCCIASSSRRSRAWRPYGREPGVHGVPGAGAARAVRGDAAWPLRRRSPAP